MKTVTCEVLCMTTEDMLRLLADAGCCVSLVYGRSGDDYVGWSVNVMSRKGLDFDAPFIADGVHGCVCIAYTEAKERNWL